MIGLFNKTLFSSKEKLSIKPQKDMENCKCILLSERSQSEKCPYYMIPVMEHFGKGKTIEKVNISTLAMCQGIKVRIEQVKHWVFF